MGRKKGSINLKNNTQAVEEKKSFRIDIASDAKRSVVAIFLFCLAIVISLGFFGKAGVVGEWLGQAAGVTIGWVKFVFPLFLCMGGVILLLRQETSFYVSKLLGLTIALFGLVGFFHWFFEIGAMREAAIAGSGGGYVGFVVAYLTVRYLGTAGGLVVIVAFFLAGFIVAFNFSIIHFFERLFKREDRNAAEEPMEKMTEPAQASAVMTETIAPTEAVLEKEDGAEENIKRIEFVEGPDQYVDESLQKELAGKEGNKKNAKKYFRKNDEQGIPEDSDWKFPPLDLLERGSDVAKGGDVQENAEIIVRTLHNFGIEVESGEIKTGPSVTQYRFKPAVGVKVSRIMSLQDDLALALAAHPIRIEAPIPGKSLIGIEVPNKVSAVVRLRDVLESSGFADCESKLTLALGEDVSGNYIFANLEKMPHLLIAGATGTGKSVGINAVLTTLLYQNSPRDMKLILVDPKRVELSLYNGIPHLLTDVIVDNGKVIGVLKWAVSEMERRYRQLQDSGSRDIASYNEKVRSGQKEKNTDPETGEVFERDLEKMPFIIIVIDELADLMGSHGKDVEGAIVRLAQMARAVGIHLIVSTQRPSVEVITGLIKANITTRIAFQVATQIDSRTIIDMAGAEKLLGKGDMLYLSASSPKPKRIQGIFLSEAEVKKVVKFIKEQRKIGEEEIGENIGAQPAQQAIEFKDFSESKDEDELYEAAKEEVIRAGKASASLLQRRLRVGYARAARLLDILEDKGIVGPQDGAKPRDVYAASSNPAYQDPVADQQQRDKWEM